MNNDNQQLEPEAENLLRTGKHANELSFIPALYSIAISLKRIADLLSDKDHIKKFGK